MTGTSLDVRSAGGMAEHFDQGNLVKRLSLGLYTVNIGVLGTFTGFSCMAFFAAPVNAYAGAACVSILSVI